MPFLVKISEVLYFIKKKYQCPKAHYWKIDKKLVFLYEYKNINSLEIFNLVEEIPRIPKVSNFLSYLYLVLAIFLLPKVEMIYQMAQVLKYDFFLYSIQVDKLI